MRALLAVVAMALWIVGAHAQTNPPAPPAASQICGVTSLTVGSTSARIAFPATSASCGVVTLKNNGTVDIFVAIGGSTIVADTSGTSLTSVPLAAGDSMPVWTNGTYIAAITATGGSTLRVYKGNGPIALKSGGGSSGGGGVGCVPSGGSAASNVVTYGSAGACAPDLFANLINGAFTLGASGTPGSVSMGNGTSGLLALQPTSGPLGAVTVLIPAASDTLANLVGTQAFNNKTIDGTLNTLLNIGNGSLTNASMTIAGHVVALGGTQALAAGDLSNGTTGSGAIVLNTSPSLTSPSLGTPTVINLLHGTGLPISTGLSGTGTGVLGAMATNVGSAGALLVFNGAGGTPSAITLTNGTGLPVGGITGFGTGVGAALAINVGSAGALVTLNGAGGTPSGIVLTNGTGLPIGSGVSGLGANVATALGLAVNASGGVLTSAAPDGTTILFASNKISTTLTDTVHSSGTSTTANIGGEDDYLSGATGATLATLATGQSLLVADISAGTLPIGLNSQTVVGCPLPTSLHNGGFYAYTFNSASTVSCYGNPGYGTITAGALTKFLDASGALGAASAADLPATPLLTGTSTTLVGPRQYYVCTGTCTVTPPVPAAGLEFCVQNDVGVSTVITMAAIGASARYGKTDQSAYGTAGTGTFISGGAAGDKICLLGKDATHYNAASFGGTWTAN